MSVLSLTLMYPMQVYTALHRRNVLGLKVPLLAAETEDVAREVMLVLSVVLRQQGSPVSKPVASPHNETGHA
jgi:hypothetical protein